MPQQFKSRDDNQQVAAFDTCNGRARDLEPCGQSRGVSVCRRKTPLKPGRARLAVGRAHRVGGGIGADIVAELILDAYQLPQRALVQEICLTPTRQTY